MIRVPPRRPTAPPTAPVLAASLLAASLLGACAGGGASTSSSGGTNVSRSTSVSSSSSGGTSEGGAPFGSVEIPEAAPADQRLQIGMDATRKLDAFVASDRVVLGEHTVVDLTRTPFLAMSAFAINRDDVERTERRDDANGVLVITLTNRTGVKTHLPALPRVEIGGLLFVGVEQLVLRYAIRTDRSRPISLRAVAERKAVYHHEAAGRKERGGRVLLEMEIVGTGDDARFVEHVRVDP